MSLTHLDKIIEEKNLCYPWNCVQHVLDKKEYTEDNSIVISTPWVTIYNETEDSFASSINHYFKLNKKEKIVFFCGMEGFYLDYLNYTFKVIDILESKFKIDPTNCVILSGASPLICNMEQYKNICKENNKKLIKIILYNHFEIWMRDAIYENELYPTLEKLNHISTKENIFLFLNGNAREHRNYLLANFIKFDILKNSLYSFLQDVEHIWYDERYGERYNNILKHIIETGTTYIPRFLSINHDNLEKAPWLFNKQVLELYEKTYFSVVGETIYLKTGNSLSKEKRMSIGNLDAMFFTEKTYRSIAFKHPFILAHRPHALKTLREMGYKTFDPYIDESYDDIENDWDRLDRIVSIVKDLCSKDEKFWVDFVKFTSVITEYNFNHLISSEYKNLTLKSGKGSKSGL